MGISGSKNETISEQEQGAQLYVSLKMESYNNNNANLIGDFVPHVYGSVPAVGSWDECKALSMERESTCMWELSFVVPPNHGMRLIDIWESLEFKFLLKPKNDNGAPCIIEEGPNRLLIGGTLQGDAKPAEFKFHGGEELECRVFVNSQRVSPFDLAASWRGYRESLLSSSVRIPDVSMKSVQEANNESSTSTCLELDLEKYVIPAPGTSANSSLVYAANVTVTPRSLSGEGVFSNADISSNTSQPVKEGGDSDDQHNDIKTHSPVSDTSRMVFGSDTDESRSLGICSTVQNQDGYQGLLVNRGVGSPGVVKSPTVFDADLNQNVETKNSMPDAAGTVAAGAIADQMLGPKEDRHLAIVLVGLPARGKTFTAAKLTRYLRWLGHDTKHFNVGKYRRLKHGVSQTADFFRADNPEGMEARNEVAALAMDDMISWMEEGGQVGIFDATNSSRKRRNMLMKMAEGKCKIIFLETICNDERIIERNIRLKVQQSPDYAELTDYEAGMQDFKNRLANYEKVYEPVDEGSYIKIIDMVSGHGGQIQVNNISGYLPGRIVFFLVNTHLTPRPIFLTRHGESVYNVRGRIGGDSAISDRGELYAKKLATFVEKRLKPEKAASIWTSTLQRTVLTASPIVGFPKIQWRALDEINAGVCDGMTYEEIKKNLPEEYDARKKEKLKYRYPRGESYLDVIQRLEPVIIELERQRAPVIVVSHQAVLRALYAYFADKPLKEIPHIEMPLHTIIEIQMGVAGVQEKRYKLME